MLKQSLKRGMGAGVALTVALAGGVAMAAPGDIAVRVGVAHVSPNDESGEVAGFGAGSEVSVDGATSLGISLTYMAGRNLGVGVLGAWPFKHDIKGAGAIAGAGKVAEVKQLPPTVTLQYHFSPDAAVRPFIGAGFNYTTFFSEKTTGALDGTDMELDDSFGWALEAGLDYSINPDWFLSGQVFYIAIDTTAKVNGADAVDVDIDPWVFMVSAGRRF